MNLFDDNSFRSPCITCEYRKQSRNDEPCCSCEKPRQYDDELKRLFFPVMDYLRSNNQNSNSKGI